MKSHIQTDKQTFMQLYTNFLPPAQITKEQNKTKFSHSKQLRDI